MVKWGNTLASVHNICHARDGLKWQDFVFALEMLLYVTQNMPVTNISYKLRQFFYKLECYTGVGEGRF